MWYFNHRAVKAMQNEFWRNLSLSLCLCYFFKRRIKGSKAVKTATRQRRWWKNESIFLVRILRMTGCVYRPLRCHISVSAQRMWTVLHSKWKFKYNFSLRFSFSGRTRLGISWCCFAEDGLEMYNVLKRTYGAIILPIWSFISPRRRRRRRRRRGLRSLNVPWTRTNMASTYWTVKIPMRH